MPAGAAPAPTCTGGLSSSSNCDLNGETADSFSLKPLSSSSNNGHRQHHHQNVVDQHLLAAPSPDAALRRGSLRSVTAAGSLHHQATRRTLRNINAIRFLRSIKVDGEPNAFTEADERISLGQGSNLLPTAMSISSSNGCVGSVENENMHYQELKKKTSGGMDLSGSSPPLPIVVDMETDFKNGAIPLQVLGHDNNMGNDDNNGRRTSSRTGAVTPLDIQVNHPIGSLPSNESPTREMQTSINVIPPTPTLPLTALDQSKHQHQQHNRYETRQDGEDDSLPFFGSADDISPTSSRSPRRTSAQSSGADHSRHHHNHHHHHYQPYHSNNGSSHRSPPRGPPREIVRVSDQVRFKHQRDDDLRFEIGDQDISSKSFRLRHASQRENSNANGVASFFLDEPMFSSSSRNNSESREISFSDMLVVTANALCRSFTDGQAHPHIQHQSHHHSLIMASPQHASSSSKSHQRQAQSEVEIRLYEYDPDRLDSPSFLQSVNRCPVVMPSYSITVLGYYDPSSAKKLLNDQFKERFPDIQLTFTKMRSLKREMKKIALKGGLDLWCVAQSYVFFEKLILKLYIKKPNRKMCAGACLLLSAKLNDIRKTKIPSLIQEIESTFRIDREDLFTTEFNVFLALDFTLMIPDCEVIPHLVRLVEQQQQQSAFGSSTSSAGLHHHHHGSHHGGGSNHGTSPTSSYALLQQHMLQHVHTRLPQTGAPTSTSSALQTSNGNGSTSTAIVPLANCSLIPYSGKSVSNVSN